MQNFGVKRGGGESKRRREGESKEQGGYKKDGDYLSVSPHLEARRMLGSEKLE